MSRTKGSPNKRTKELQALLEERYPDFNPVERMAALAQDSDVEMAHRVTCLKEVAGYLYPKRKAVELDVSEETLDAVKIVWGKTR